MWTEQVSNTLKILWIQGHSAQAIADRLAELGINKTRASVIGRANRMQLPVHENYRKRSEKTARKKAYEYREGGRGQKLPVGPEACGVTLADLGANQCRYPLGKFWCAATTESPISSWCEMHSKVVFSGQTGKITVTNKQKYGDSHVG